MKCPFCRQSNNHVIDSRLGKDEEMIRRRRECIACSRRFTTYERVEEAMPMVVKKDGRREAFDRLKIINGLKRACQKRPVSMDAIEVIADRIERGIQERGEKEIPGSIIGEAAMRELHDTDPVAYVRFASVYRSFKGPQRVHGGVGGPAQRAYAPDGRHGSGKTGGRPQATPETLACRR